TGVRCSRLNCAGPWPRSRAPSTTPTGGRRGGAPWARNRWVRARGRRRAAVTGTLVLPPRRRPVPDVAVVCDTSGSMTEDLLAAALAEVEGLMRALGMARQAPVRAGDPAAGAAQRVSSARQVELVGGGGTDMGTGIAAAAALRPRPAITVGLTHGFTPWADEPPRGIRVVVGLLGDAAPEAPAWARMVRIPSAPR